MESIDRFKAELNDLLGYMIGHSVTIVADNGFMQCYVPIFIDGRRVLWDMYASNEVRLNDLKVSDLFEIMEAFDKEKNKINMQK